MESVEGDTNNILLLLNTSMGFSASNATVLMIIILSLLLFSAIIAGAETAFFSLAPKDINFLKTNEKANAKTAVQLLEQPKILLATMLVANNTINIAIVICTNYLISFFFSSFNFPPGVSFLINVICVTFLLVLFGEVLPKVYATQNNLRMVIFTAPYMKALWVLFLPLSKFLVSSTRFIETRLTNKKSTNMSSKDFEHAIELTVGHSATKEEVNIFKGILKFGAITARQVMRTRMDVSAIDYEWSFAEAKNYCVEAGYSRLPVFNESLDKVAGIVHTKDFLPFFDKEELDWHALMRPAYFVHESKLIDDLLKEFQQKHIHFAIVVDEFGGTSGIITLEDIMEEIIGDIRDEFDDEDLNYKKLDDRNYIFEGKMLINDVCRVIGEQTDKFESARGESDSLAGLLLEISGKFPAINEIIRYDNFEFMVVALDKMRIQRVKLTINIPAEKDAASIEE